MHMYIEMTMLCVMSETVDTEIHLKEAVKTTRRDSDQIEILARARTRKRNIEIIKEAMMTKEQEEEHNSTPTPPKSSCCTTVWWWSWIKWVYKPPDPPPTHHHHHMPLTLTTVAAPELTADESALLRAAIADWFDAGKFDDNKVLQTKAIFQKVFENDAQLEGLALKDSLMLTPQNDPTRRYCAVVCESGLEWMVLSVSSASFQFFDPQSLEFSEFLMFESASAARYEDSSSDEEEEAEDEEVFVGDENC